ncbi:MAG: hypothetical protein LBI03_04805 [Clostridiales bacterium]|jgi:exopolyphosphatase/guanosine-5'-triphosphate,3'-diphosphate pyrophosphatase|nr:hypothetical protein [Clostridiales bacterium]
MKKRVVSVIDLGSNSARMTITMINTDGTYSVLENTKTVCRLSEGLTGNNSISQIAMDRTLSTLRIYSRIIDSYRKKISDKADFKVIALGTAVLRKASNKEEFLNLVMKETGIKVSVISGIEEAEYSYLGVINTLPVNDALLIDTGGGSTELIMVKGGKLIQAESVPIGAVNLSEMFNDFDKMKSYTKEQLFMVEWLQETANFLIVGIGGSIRNMGKIHQAVNGNSTSQIHGYTMKGTDILSIVELINKTPMRYRKEIPGIEKKRADIILGGLCPLTVLIENNISLGKYSNTDPALIISMSGVREGAFYKEYSTFKE